MPLPKHDFRNPIFFVMTLTLNYKPISTSPKTLGEGNVPYEEGSRNEEYFKSKYVSGVEDGEGSDCH